MVRIPTHAPPTHPGEMLQEEFIKPLALSQGAVAAALDISRDSLSKVLNGHRSVTPEMALRLEQAFGMEAQFWLNLQLAWDLYHAMRSPQAPKIRRIKRLTAPPAIATQDRAPACPPRRPSSTAR